MKSRRSGLKCPSFVLPSFHFSAFYFFFFLFLPAFCPLDLNPLNIIQIKKDDRAFCRFPFFFLFLFPPLPFSFSFVETQCSLPHGEPGAGSARTEMSFILPRRCRFRFYFFLHTSLHQDHIFFLHFWTSVLLGCFGSSNNSGYMPFSQRYNGGHSTYSTALSNFPPLPDRRDRSLTFHTNKSVVVS